VGGYIPATSAEQQEMLVSIGLMSFDELFTAIPDGLRVEELDIPAGRSEYETAELLKSIAAKNVVFPVLFRGAGAYAHFVPAIVKSVAGKEEFITAYTPYQAELSQGLLQSIFEYQTMICELTGMDVSNASVYDGATAAAEAVSMCRTKGRTKTLMSATVHPMVSRTVQTYCEAVGMEFVLVPAKQGMTDATALAELLDDQTSCFYVQQPNFFGLIEDAAALGEVTRAAGSNYVMGVNPIAAALLKTPRACGADIAVGDGQPLGMSIAFGGPYLGFMTCTSELMRRMPGRIVGETVDGEGRRAYVLTLQAREQHIRREKASSNICSNQAHCALTAGAYMASMGPVGMRKVAELCYSKAHYAAKEITAIAGVELAYPGDFFHEFVTTLPGCAEELLGRLESEGILGGLPVEDGILWCVTEMNTKAQIDRLVQIVREVVGA